MASMNGESEEPSKVYKRKPFKGVKTNMMMQTETNELGSDEGDLMKRQVLDDDDGGGKFGFVGEENRVTISLDSKSKKELREYRRKLQGELNLVRKWMRKIEAKEKDVANVGDSGKGGVKKRVRSEVESRPLNQLSVSVVENSQGGIENVEKEKRTPKVNQFYRNSEFLLGKDKLPPVDKKGKVNGKKQSGGDVGFGLGKFTSQLFKSCNGLLERLMKHKHGWVFNVPVDVKVLGLHDYFDIIKEPMDLGTVKSRLNKKFYKTPIEFAEDVRLTFRNGMTYNPNGHDVHVMAEQLLQIFEEKWVVIEADYLRELKLVVDHEGSLPTPTSTSKKAHMPRQPPVETNRALERSESITPSPDLNTKLVNLGHRGRPAAPKKPKARDPNKREMTYDEKQKLSSNLQTLPAEKLESVVEIIKKRNSSLCQRDDEIEVDIDSFDTETLWELDRFVINYKKYLSKNKKSAGLAHNEKPPVEQSDQNENPAPVVDLVEDTSKETGTGDKEATSTSAPVKHGNQTKKTSQASKSNSSSSDSGSSSGGSDSGSSSRLTMD